MRWILAALVSKSLLPDPNNTTLIWVTSGLRREAAVHCTLLGYEPGSGSNFLPTFRHDPSLLTV